MKRWLAGFLSKTSTFPQIGFQILFTNLKDKFGNKIEDRTCCRVVTEFSLKLTRF